MSPNPDQTLPPWHGFERISFDVRGHQAWIALPRHPAPGNPWLWCLEFPEAFDDRTGAVPLCESGVAYAHVVVGNTYGCPDAQETFDAFHAEMVRRGYARKAALLGLSRGGLYAYRFAARRPECVACLYGDAPVCDFRSWPGGFGTGKGSPDDWASLKNLYGFANDLEAFRYDRLPIDALEPIARAGIPILHVVGETDHVVPVSENTNVLVPRYRALGGSIEVYRKVPASGIAGNEEIPDAADPHVLHVAPAGCDHHPHGLSDPSPQVAFIRRALGV